MKAKWVTAVFVASALLVPVEGFAADAKEVVDDSVITTKIKPSSRLTSR